MNRFLANDPTTLSNLLSISRIVSALFSSVDSYKLDLIPYADRLNKAFQKFL